MRARDLDPLSLPVNNALAGRLLAAGRYDEALEQVQKTLQLDPHFAPAHQTLGWIYLHNGRRDDAIREFQRALQLSAHGMPLWLLVAGAPLIYCALILIFMTLYFAVAWIHRAERPPQARIGIGATLRLVANEYRALVGAAPRMILYKLLLHDPVPAPADAPVLLLHGVLCNAGQWAPFARGLAARNVHPIYTMSYGPPLASIDVFADQVAQKIDAILAETGAVDVEPFFGAAF